MKGNNFSVTIFGASGLVGKHLLQQLILNPSCNLIQIPVRSRLHIEHSKIREVPFAFNQEEYHSLSPTDVVVCAIGTTQKKVQGNQNAYRKVDHDIAIHAAQWAENIKCKQFQLISAIGANARRGNFYTRLKGEIENNILQTHVPQIVCFRPSLLLGKRNETRWAEGIGQLLLPLLAILIPQKYRPIKALELSKIMMKKRELCHQNVSFKLIWEKGNSE